MQAVGAEVEWGTRTRATKHKETKRQTENRTAKNRQFQRTSVYQMPPNPATLPHSRSHRKVVGFKGQECSYITVCECAQKEQSLRALKYIYVYTYCGMMKLATQRAQLQIISIMTTATKPNKVQKALEICNSKLSIAYF